MLGKRAQGKNIGSVNLKPSRKNCIAWIDRKGNTVYREDFENEKYKEYKETLKDSSKAVPKEIFIATLWDNKASLKKTIQFLE